MLDCQGGDRRSGNPALTRPTPVQSACGAAIKTSHPVRFSIGQSVAIAPLILWGVAGTPAEVGNVKTACGLRAGRIPPPLQFEKVSPNLSIDVCQKL